MNKILLTYILLLAILTNGFTQPFTISTDTDSILIGKPISITVSLQKETLSDVVWPTFMVGDSLGESFKILEVLPKDTLTKDKLVLSQKLIVTSFEPGIKTFKPQIIYTKGGIITSNSINIQVSLVKADTTQPIHDIKPIKQPSITFKDRWSLFVKWLKDNWYIAIFIFLVFIFLIWFMFFRSRKKKQENIIAKEIVPEIPAHVLAFDSLDKLNKEELWQKGKQKEYNVRLTNVIKQYITNRYKVSVKGKTSHEILQEGKLVIGYKNRENLRKLLTLSDLVKFAKEKPTEEQNRGVMQDAVNFVKTTKKQN